MKSPCEMYPDNTPMMPGSVGEKEYNEAMKHEYGESKKVETKEEKSGEQS